MRRPTKTVKQQGQPGKHQRRALAALALSCASVAGAQEIGPSTVRPWIVEPFVSVRQLFTDNRDLQSDKRSGSITELGAGVHVGAFRGNLRGSLDYALSGTVVAQERDRNAVHHALAAAGTAEVIEGQGFIDVTANYSQQLISAFGTRSLDRTIDDDNRTDLGSVSVSPHLRGRLGSLARYDVRAYAQTTRAKNTEASDVDSASLTLRLLDGGSHPALGWFAEASHFTSDFKAGRRTFNTRYRAGVSYLIGNEVRLGINGGRERTDLAVLGGASNSTYGASVQWTPGPRTSLEGEVEHRWFGTSHSLRFAHRTPNTAWALSSSKDISTTTREGIGAVAGAYDLFFRQFASLEPDEVKRDALVRNFLRINGIDPNAAVIGGFLASSATLRSAQRASVALVGALNTITLQVAAARDERADRFASALDDLSNVGKIRQRGVMLDWAYRLSPQSSVSVGGAVQRSSSDTAAYRSTLKSLQVGWTGSLGPRTTVSAGARRAEFDSRSSSSYDENAVYGALRMSF